MNSTITTLRWLHFALFGLALWFFGNLYEEVILLPNWLAASLSVLQAYNRYYSVVIQYHYYVPVTQVAVVVLVALCFTSNPARQTDPSNLRRAALWGTLGLVLTALIVINLNLRLFVGELTLSETEAHRLGLIWMVGNGIRLFCVGMSFRYALSVRDRLRT
ncbi:hypothetical protein [Fibrella aquatilis]|uniref:Uncharacterized protein n=1 Tax=Fibrella aquatilis TaxID=2817059 RepID=A0A939K0F4_9BACT|nr:hypothetical protein [Fibrella aquatilis]MBO0931946.1 hypothetical protein [Fibrella aquatilis]